MNYHPIDDYVEATFAGRTWKLSLGLRAEVEFERLRGKEIGPVLAKFLSNEAGGMNLKSMLSGFGAEDFCAIVWAMAKRYEPAIPFERFIDLLHISDIKRLFSDITAAAAGAYGLPHKDDPIPEKTADPLTPPTGTPSGPSVGSTSD